MDAVTTLFNLDTLEVPRFNGAEPTRRDRRGLNRITHGMRRSGPKPRVYRIWQHMRNRCGNLNNKKYADYGGRWITVCERWQSFAAFYADMGEPPSVKHEIDRIDNDKGYEPSNCRWATHSENSRNRRVRSDSVSGLKGVSRRGKRWGASINSRRIGSFATAAEAAMAYDREAVRLYGQFARLNYPLEARA